MRYKVGLIFAFILLAAGLWFFYQTAAIASRGGEDTPLYSAERHDPYGTAALKDLLTERGVSTSLLLRPTPDPTTGTVLIEVLSDQSHELFDAPGLQMQRLKDWIEQGNTVIQFTRSTTRLMTEYHLTAPVGVRGNETEAADPHGKSQPDAAKIEAAEAHGKPQSEIPAEREDARWIASPTAKGERLLTEPASLEFYSALVLKPEKEHSPWHPLAVNDQDQWVGATCTVGKGRLIVIGGPTPVLNGTLGDAANLEFVLALIGASPTGGYPPVLFDEWSHGLGHERTIVGFIRQVGLLPTLLQLFFVVALYVWATSGFSPADEPANKRRRSSSEQIDTLGHLYSQAMTPDLVFARVYAEVRNRLALVLRCSPAAIEQALARSPRAIAQRGTTILEHLQAIGRGRGPACPKCGYDLTRNTSGICPECGAQIAWRIKNRIAHADDLADVPERRKTVRKADLRLAAALSESHQFVEEFARDRNRRP